MKPHPHVLDRNRSVLLMIDLQEAYRGKLANEPRVIATAVKLLDAAGLLRIPVVVTEQYPKGLGPTRDELVSHLPANARRFEKTTFSGLGAPGLREHLRELGREQIVVAGIETHV
ncbi:MAG TPA: hydrolase, partial [Deltaproteobacteria bacterium]|nr:hydrolase [Deltaproteobacteria bacterium]